MSHFKDARHFASWFGLTPREFSSGNSRVLGRISKKGDRYLRMLLTHGARAVLRAASLARAAGKTLDGLRSWGLAVQERANHNKAACAVANKLARICYATLRDGEPYGTPSRLSHKLNRSDFAIAQFRHCPIGLQGENPRCVPRPRACFEIDRPSWLFGSHPHATMPITLPAASRLPLVAIGTACADSMSARATQSSLQMPDIRLHALPRPHYRSVSLLFGGVHIRKVRARASQPLTPPQTYPARTSAGKWAPTLMREKPTQKTHKARKLFERL